MKRATIVLLMALTAPVQASDPTAAVVLVCDALGELGRAVVDLRYAGVPQEIVERHLAMADPSIAAPMTQDLVYRAFRLPNTESLVVRARFRNSTGAAVVSECLPRLSAAVTERAKP